jgi:hypothetical protein
VNLEHTTFNLSLFLMEKLFSIYVRLFKIKIFFTGVELSSQIQIEIRQSFFKFSNKIIIPYFKGGGPEVLCELKVGRGALCL